jgi:hypothetical protein
VGKWLVGFATVGAIALGLVAFYELAFRSGRGGESSPLYSARRHDPYGTAALADLLTERGVEVRYLERPRLDDADHGVLIQVLPLPREQPSKGPVSPSSAAARDPGLLDWIAKGNIVVQFTRAETDLMSAFLRPADSADETAVPPWRAGRARTSWEGPDAREIEKHEAAGRFPDKLPGELLSADWTSAAREILGRQGGLPQPMRLRSPLRLMIGPHSAARPLAVCGNQIVASESRFGAGRVIFIGAPTPALNGGLDEGGNLDFILALVGKGPVILDEWSHGIGREDSIMGVIRRFGLLPFLFQVIFVLGLYIWSMRANRPPERVEPARWPAGIEQIATLGHLYGQAFSREETALRVRQEVLRRLASALRCPVAEIENQRAHLEPREADRVGEIIISAAGEPAAQRAALERALAESLTESHKFLEEKSHGRSIA